MSPDGLALIGPLALAALRQSGWQVDAIGGLTLGADPISYAIAYASASSDAPSSCFYRAQGGESTRNGSADRGPFREGDRVVVIEDVITTGGSALRAVEAIRAAGGSVSGVLALVDREEGGREALEDAGLSVIVLARASEIVGRLRDA